MTRNEVIGERIQNRRKFLNRRMGGFTQENVVEMLEQRGLTMDPANYSHYELGRNRITAELLEHLAVILQVPVEWFYGDDDVEIDDVGKEVIAWLKGYPQGLSQTSRRVLEHARQTVDDIEKSLA